MPTASLYCRRPRNARVQVTWLDCDAQSASGVIAVSDAAVTTLLPGISCGSGGRGGIGHEIRYRDLAVMRRLNRKDVAAVAAKE